MSPHIFLFRFRNILVSHQAAPHNLQQNCARACVHHFPLFATVSRVLVVLAYFLLKFLISNLVELRFFLLQLLRFVVGPHAYQKNKSFASQLRHDDGNHRWRY